MSSRGKDVEVRQILSDAGMVMLDGDAVELAGRRHRRRQRIWRRLRSARARRLGRDDHQAVRPRSGERGAEARNGSARAFGPPSRIALLHYCADSADSRGRAAGDLPFVGSSRLEDPIDRFSVSLVMHGHAHRGQLEGVTKARVPVYNVSMPLLARAVPGSARRFACSTCRCRRHPPPTPAGTGRPARRHAGAAPPMPLPS